MVDAIVQNGLDLLGIKEMLAHGQFENWVATACRISERTARYYMATARAFEGKTAIIADLSASTIFALTSFETVRAEVIKKREAGEGVDERAISDMLWKHRQEAKTSKAEAKLTPAQRKQAMANRAKREAAWQKEREERTAEHEKRMAALVEAAAIIATRFGDDLPELLAVIDETGFQMAVFARALRNAAQSGVQKTAGHSHP